jgi:photosystem II stability/assembly factor-like uncharacterized protein
MFHNIVLNQMKTRFLWCFAVCISLCLSALRGQEIRWEEVNGPTGADVLCFATSNSAIFAGTYGNGLYRSTDNGVSWKEVNTENRYVRTFTLAVNGATIFAGTEGSGIFRSTDNGASWQALSGGLPPNGQFLSLAINGTTIFAGGDRLYRSDDNGTNWQVVNIDSPSSYLT